MYLVILKQAVCRLRYLENRTSGKFFVFVFSCGIEWGSKYRSRSTRRTERKSLGIRETQIPFFDTLRSGVHLSKQK